jgi:xanthine dehydrogenase accessory factor
MSLRTSRPAAEGSDVRERILIKGAGEQASASAHRLFRCGYRVVMTDLEQPTAVRRTVSFCSAIYDGEITIEGVRGVRHRLEDLDTLSDAARTHIPVVVDAQSLLVRLWRPDVIVDGRLLKHNLDNHKDDAPLVIGLGPGLEAGRDVDFVVETMRGHDLGRIIDDGFTSKDTGQPGEIGGYGRERVLRAPTQGVFESPRRIGDHVTAGEVIGTVAETEIRAEIPGVLRGLLRPGLMVGLGAKLADVDPRNEPALCCRISDKARTTSGSVLEIVVTHGGRRSISPS